MSRGGVGRVLMGSYCGQRVSSVESLPLEPLGHDAVARSAGVYPRWKGGGAWKQHSKSDDRSMVQVHIAKTFIHSEKRKTTKQRKERKKKKKNSPPSSAGRHLDTLSALRSSIKAPRRRAIRMPSLSSALFLPTLSHPDCKNWRSEKATIR